jgi:hypothetical protein
MLLAAVLEKAAPVAGEPDLVRECVEHPAELLALGASAQKTRQAIGIDGCGYRATNCRCTR